MIYKDLGYNVTSKINEVQLYVMFQTDMDFGVDLDGLESFINNGLTTYCVKYSFRAERIPLGEHEDNHRLVKLSVTYPWWTTETKMEHSWHEDAIEEVMLPAYMWLFAQIGIGNRHCLSGYYTRDPFIRVSEGYSCVEIEDGVILCPKTDIMSGNYSGSWAQWRFVCDYAENYGDDKDFVSDIKLELARYYGDDEDLNDGQKTE